MDLNIQIPDNTASIFEYLQKGLFISSNSTSEEVRDMYNEIDENYEPLYQYFSQINYTLERGNEYFFSPLLLRILSLYLHLCKLINSWQGYASIYQAGDPRTFV